VHRSLLTILIVAATSAWLGRTERAAGVGELKYAAPNHPEWVRTADGWQHRIVLRPEPPSRAFDIHPGLVAAFQLGFSLLVLVAFPGKAVPVRRPAPPADCGLALPALDRKRRRRISAAVR
jgi:hypothetical protein